MYKHACVSTVELFSCVLRFLHTRKTNVFKSHASRELCFSFNFTWLCEINIHKFRFCCNLYSQITVYIRWKRFIETHMNNTHFHLSLSTHEHFQFDLNMFSLCDVKFYWLLKVQNELSTRIHWIHSTIFVRLWSVHASSKHKEIQWIEFTTHSCHSKRFFFGQF